MDSRVLSPQCSQDIGGCRAGPHIRSGRRWERPFHHLQPSCRKSSGATAGVIARAVCFASPPRHAPDRILRPAREPARRSSRSCRPARRPRHWHAAARAAGRSAVSWRPSCRAPCPARLSHRGSSACGGSGRRAWSSRFRGPAGARVAAPCRRAAPCPRSASVSAQVPASRRRRASKSAERGPIPSMQPIRWQAPLYRNSVLILRSKAAIRLPGPASSSRIAIASSRIMSGTPSSRRLSPAVRTSAFRRWLTVRAMATPCSASRLRTRFASRVRPEISLCRIRWTACNSSRSGDFGGVVPELRLRHVLHRRSAGLPADRLGAVAAVRRGSGAASRTSWPSSWTTRTRQREPLQASMPTRQGRSRARNVTAASRRNVCLGTVRSFRPAPSA